MVARLQSFPDDWVFTGKKTAQYRQIGNAFPPLVARAAGRAILAAFERRCPEMSEDSLMFEQRFLEQPAVYRAKRKKPSRKD